MSAKLEKLSNFFGSTKVLSLTRKSLAKLKLKAVRRGVWFSVLKHEERKLLDLTVHVVKRVHSFMLAKLICKVVEKLFVAMESMVYRLMQTKGHVLAEKLMNIAQAWGNTSAKSWNANQSFSQYLTVTHLLSQNPIELGKT